MSLAMNMGEFAQLPEAGRDGLHAARSASGPRRVSRRAATAEDPAPFLAAWETAYRRYGQASERSLRSPEGDPATVQQMAATSRAVAAAWRQIAQASRLPWWSLAAVESAAQAFEAQARDWEARKDQGGSALDGSW